MPWSDCIKKTSNFYCAIKMLQSGGDAFYFVVKLETTLASKKFTTVTIEMKLVATCEKISLRIKNAKAYTKHKINNFTLQ